MDITPAGAVPSRRMPSDYFTGTVWQDPIVEAPAPARIRAALVTFEPAARTAWHTHPLGQTLHVVRGTGRVQTWGGPIREIRAGDTVWIPPGEKHWHGAAPHRDAGGSRRRPRAVDGARHRRAVRGEVGLIAACSAWSAISEAHCAIGHRRGAIKRLRPTIKAPGAAPSVTSGSR
jgi:quercetin dioxygenase-like cupin family protein